MWESRNEITLSGADSVLGMLQRGRGSGFLHAIEIPKEQFWSMLFQCVTQDPRWDRQTEARGDYYARLIITTKMDFNGFSKHLRACDIEGVRDIDVGLVFEVLGFLAKCGIFEAIEILWEYVANGVHWSWAVGELVETEIEDYVRGLDKIICNRFTNDNDILEGMRKYIYGGNEPWQTLSADNDRLARIWEETKDFNSNYYFQEWQELPPPPEDYDALSLIELLSFGERLNHLNRGELLRLVDQKACQEDLPILKDILGRGGRTCTSLVFRALGEIGTSDAFEIVKSVIESNPNGKGFVYTQALRSLQKMPGYVCLEQGRKWFFADEWLFRKAGENILEAHATREDLMTLLQAVKDTAASDKDTDIHRLCSVLEGLSRFHNIGWFSEIEEAFYTVRSSFVRNRTSKTLLALDANTFSEKLAYECLWDCEPQTREIGCKYVNIEELKNATRLKEIIEDNYEEDEVRETARNRIE